MAWSRALRAVDSVSRILPLSSDGGKRGRTLSSTKQWSDVSLGLLAVLRAIPYLGPNLFVALLPMTRGLLTPD